VTAVFSREEDKRRVWGVLPKRVARYGLTPHPEKTRLITFRRPSGTAPGVDRDTTARPTSFDMLGFTHFWSRSLRGYWVIKRKSARGRLSRALRAIAQWCQQHRHAPISWQHAVLSRKLRGHYSYYGITGNSVAITRFRHEVRSRWRKWLNRRGGRSPMSWPQFHRLEERHLLPAAIAVHSSYRRAANP
jgi:RNA-directed DNA polymerase